MHPILFEYGPLHIYSWGLMVGLGILVGLWVALRLAQKEGIDPEKIVNLTIWVVVAGVLGARIVYCVTFWDYYQSRPWEVLWISAGGLTWFGSVLFVVPTMIWLLRRWKLPVWKVADIVAVSVWPGYAIGRIGCFLNGCCYGIETHGALGMKFPHLLEPRLPTQLFSSLIGLLFFFIFFFVVYPRKKYDGQVFFAWLGAWMIYRFGIEFFRDNPRWLLNMTIGQWAIIAIAPLLIFWYQWFRKNRSNA